MIVNELRKGNFVKSKLIGAIHQVTGILPNGDIYTSLQSAYSELIDWEPIPLSGDILVKAGFENIHGEHCEQFRKGKILIELIPDGSVCIRLEPGYKSWAYVVDHIKSLHSFQNLIFALTGTELEINL